MKKATVMIPFRSLDSRVPIYIDYLFACLAFIVATSAFFLVLTVLLLKLHEVKRLFFGVFIDRMPFRRVFVTALLLLDDLLGLLG